ncbi:peptidase family M50-domain-containing protein, partial [Mrakia frigida]|uniref:peptidase family M50-domain-containing protein n=1 Tax=Mrakia frigida TaxID=29902 RepID=UPI003FCC16E0
MPSHLFLILLAFLWVVFQLGKRSPFTRRRLQHLLRRSSSSSPNLDLDDDDDETLWTVKTTLIGIQVSTTTFNEIPSRILGLLGKDQRRWLARGYDLGILWGMVGMLATIGILSWEGLTFGVWLLRVVGNSRSGEAVGKVVKRALEEGTSSGGGGKLSEGIIRPLIPGVTLPLSQATYLIFSFLLGQIVHEPGHALAAALSNLSPLLSSIHLSPLLPSASVTLPSTALGDLPTRQRARIAAAGCWHNVLFAGFVWGVSLLSPLGSERFVGDLGRGVLSVDKDSSLYSVLPRGAVITQLDDVPMAASSASTSDDIWTSYLTQPSHLALTENGKIDPHKGWCVPKEWYLNQPETCISSSSLLLFNPTSPSRPPTVSASNPPFPPPNESRCLPINPLLTSTFFDPGSTTSPQTPSPERGFAHCPCSDEKREMCVAIDGSEKILRILFVKSGGRKSIVGEQPKWIVWQGNREQVFLQVQTSSNLPSSFIPPFLYPLFHHITLFKAYFLLISFTLAVFNLLPLPILDGGLLLACFLEWMIPNDRRSSRVVNEDESESDLELLEAGIGEGRERGSGSRSEKKRKRWERVVHWGVGGLGCWVLGGIFLRLI